MARRMRRLGDAAWRTRLAARSAARAAPRKVGDALWQARIAARSTTRSAGEAAKAAPRRLGDAAWRTRIAARSALKNAGQHAERAAGAISNAANTTSRAAGDTLWKARIAARAAPRKAGDALWRARINTRAAMRGATQSVKDAGTRLRARAQGPLTEAGLRTKVGARRAREMTTAAAKRTAQAGQTGLSKLKEYADRTRNRVRTERAIHNAQRAASRADRALAQTSGTAPRRNIAGEIGRRMVGLEENVSASQVKRGIGERIAGFGDFIRSGHGQTVIARGAMRNVSNILSRVYLRAAHRGGLVGHALVFAIGIARDHVRAQVHRLGREQVYFETAQKVMRGETEHLTHSELRHARQHADKYGGSRANNLRAAAEWELQFRESVRRKEKFERQQIEAEKTAAAKAAKEAKRAAERAEKKAKAREEAKQNAKERGARQLLATMEKKDLLHMQKLRHKQEAADHEQRLKAALTPHAPGVGAGTAQPRKDPGAQTKARQTAMARVATQRQRVADGKPPVAPKKTGGIQTHGADGKQRVVQGRASVSKRTGKPIFITTSGKTYYGDKATAMISALRASKRKGRARTRT